MTQTNIRDVDINTLKRFKSLKAMEGHKTLADTLKFLLDYYEKE